MSRYKLKKRRIDFWFWLIIAIIAVIPALPLVLIWMWLSPITFWQKLLLFFIEAVIIYPTLLGIELLILKLLD